MNSSNAQTNSLILCDKYKIIRQIGEYGESVVYSGIRHDTNAKINVYEYFPKNLATKDPLTGEIKCNVGCEVMFKSLLEDFIELGSLLRDMSRTGRYSMVACYDMVRQNNTVYTVFEDPESPTFEDFLARHGSLGWTTLRRMITPVVNVLSALHAKGYYHRGISPCNLTITSNQTLKLAGFCIPASRTAQSEIDSTLYFGYSALEQHTISSWQGAWTDVYGLAATCYRALTGVSVVDSRQRKTQPKLITPIEYDNEIPLHVSDAIMKALCIVPEGRYSTIEEFWRCITNDAGTTVAFEGVNTSDLASPQVSKSSVAIRWLTPIIISIIILGGAYISYNAIINPDYFIKADNPSVSSTSSVVESSSGLELDVLKENILPNFTDKYIETVLASEKYTEKYDFSIQWKYTETHPYGTVISQTPQAGEIYEKREAKLLVSKGSEFITMPNIIGKDESMVVEMLTSLDIKFELLEIIDIQSKSKTIIQSSVGFGETISKVSDVVIIYSVRNF